MEELLAAVVFDAAGDADGAHAWEAGRASLVSGQRDLAAIALVAGRRAGGRRRGLSFVQWASPSLVAKRVDDAIDAHTRAGASKLALDALHTRALAGDLGAQADFCAGVFTEVRRQLRAARPREDPDFIDMALDDALARYGARPETYDPDRGHPFALFRKMAIDRLVDLQRSRGRRLAHEVTAGIHVETVELAAEPFDDPAERASDFARLAELRVQFLAVCRTARDRAFVHAWLDGGRHADLATVLELDHLLEDAQKADVQRTKVRLRQAAQRRWLD